MKLDENQIIEILDSRLYYESDTKVKDLLHGVCAEAVAGVVANSPLGDMILDVMDDKINIDTLDDKQKRRISRQIVSYIFYG